MVSAPKILTVVQARMGSTRLPGKVLKEMPDGRPVLTWVLERAELIGYPVCLAIPDTAADDPLLNVEGPWTYLDLGSEDDVLDRYWGAASFRAGADHIIRVTADCPLLDPEAARMTVMEHLHTGADFTHYIAEGRAVEVFTREALERSWREAKDPFQREHPDEYILQNPGLFHIETLKFSVDTQQDLDRVRRFASGERPVQQQGKTGSEERERAGQRTVG